MFIKPNPHIGQSLNQIVSVRDPHFRDPQGFAPQFGTDARLTCCCVIGFPCAKDNSTKHGWAA